MRSDIYKTHSLTQLLCYAIGWQGGTIHQVAETTGLSVDWIASTNALEAGAKNQNDGDFRGGWFCVRTCGQDYVKEKVIPNRKGDEAFWLGAVSGIVDSMHLGESRMGYRHNFNA